MVMQYATCFGTIPKTMTNDTTTFPQLYSFYRTGITTIRIFHPQHLCGIKRDVTRKHGRNRTTSKEGPSPAPQISTKLSDRDREDPSAISSVFDVVLPHPPTRSNFHLPKTHTLIQTHPYPIPLIFLLELCVATTKTERGRCTEVRSIEMPILHEKLTRFAR